ncbi:MAG: hypothetical protein KGK12_11270 [Armatimonadetes bacterium]|nr:hypothetical protein [Armatimonadota bacterium]
MHQGAAGSWLLTGESGSGKRALALAFAMACCCTNPVAAPPDACGECAACLKTAAGENPEVSVLTPAGETFLIGQFWDRDSRGDPGAIARNIHFAPNLGRMRVYILDGAERMSPAAANSLLKVLEEPPDYAIFMLLATHASRVLPTIVSRCRSIRLHPAPIDELAEYIVQRHQIPPAEARRCARVSHGLVGAAISLAVNPGVREEIDRVMAFAVTLPSAPPVRALRVGEQIRKLAQQMKLAGAAEPAEVEEPSKERASRRQCGAVIDLLAATYSDLLHLSVRGDADLDAVGGSDELRAAARGSNPRRWMRCMDSLVTAKCRIEAGANIALVTDVLAMELLTVEARA